MIAFVHGMAVDMTENSVVVEAGGIGYEIYMTGADLSEIRMGEDVKVHTYFSVREDAMKLYGFRTKDDLQMFKLLLGVNGVGPKDTAVRMRFVRCVRLRMCHRMMWKVF